MKKLIPFVIVVMFCACAEKKSKIDIFNAKWHFSKIELEQNESLDDIEKNVNNYLAKNANLDIHFLGSDTVAWIIDKHYSLYKYSVDKSNGNISFYNGDSLESKFEKIKLTEKDISTNWSMLNANVVFKLDTTSIKLSNNAMHPQFNTWRTKATASETDKQLLQRLLNLFKHYVYLIENSETRNEKAVDFGASQSNIKIYNGGIGIFDNTSKEWADIFYDTNDKIRFDELFTEVLKKSPAPNFESSGSWVKDDVKILKLLIAQAGKMINE